MTARFNSPPSKGIRAALVFCSLAVLAIAAAHFGEWRTIHWDFPEEFTRDPNSPDHEYAPRTLLIYWMTRGTLYLSAAGFLWLVGWGFFLVAAIRHCDSLKSWSGRSCLALHTALISYCAWFFLHWV